MTERVQVGGLQVAKVLYDFVNEEALPGTGVDVDGFWSGAVKVIEDLAPKNRALLATRDDLQAKIDAWHRDRAGAPVDPAEYRAFLTEIGYLVPEPAPFAVSTANVDTEITATAGPQLVVPVLNARFALNASNARWGSLYDALYGTNAIPEDGGAEPGDSYNKVRGDRVIAWARGFLDTAAPLAPGSHADAARYLVDGGALTVELGDGTVTGLAEPDKFVGYLGDPTAPTSRAAAQPRAARGDPARPDLPDRLHGCGRGQGCGARVRGHHHHGLRGLGRRRRRRRQGGRLPQLAGPEPRGSGRGDQQGRHKSFTRRLNPDRVYTAPDGSELTLHGRSLLFVRNVGHLMTTPAILHADGSEVPEGILDALLTSLCAVHGLSRSEQTGPLDNSRTGSVYIVKPKQHGPDEVAFTTELFGRVEQVLGLPAQHPQGRDHGRGTPHHGQPRRLHPRSP